MNSLTRAQDVALSKSTFPGTCRPIYSNDKQEHHYDIATLNFLRFLNPFALLCDQTPQRRYTDARIEDVIYGTPYDTMSWYVSCDFNLQNPLYEITGLRSIPVSLKVDWLDPWTDASFGWTSCIQMHGYALYVLYQRTGGSS